MRPDVFYRITRLALAAAALWAGSVQAATFPRLEANTVVGSVQFTVARHEDTLLSLAEEFELGYEELAAANSRLDSWLPGEGRRVVLPKKFIIPKGPGEGIYINLAEYRLYYFPRQKSGRVMTFPISIGRGDWGTPEGAVRVVSKLVDPAWYPPRSIREEHARDGDPLPAVVPPGPDNPLGTYALKLSLPGYLIHGTNRPYGIGMKVTHGCIRLHPRNMALLFGQVAVNTPVRIVWEPFKVGVRNNTVYVAAHPLGSEVEKILGVAVNDAEMQERQASALTGAIRATLQALDGILAEKGQGRAQIDWLKLTEVIRLSDGIPHPVSVTFPSSEQAENFDGPLPEAPRKQPPGSPAAAQKPVNYLF